jgi:Asp-tRNA(Asn)/Glu-tRNA(Gln) amidotransferase A subunit family amidase
LVKLLLQAGGIPLVRGNCPQMALGLHSKNSIWGSAMNPYDSQRTCGGASGGDAALVAMRCVPFAIGTDALGSMRISSSFCGVTAFTPT